MQEQASRALSGAQVGPWYAPNITSDPATGIGSWSAGRARGLFAQRTFARKGAGCRKHGRSHRTQLPASVGCGYRGHRHLREERHRRSHDPLPAVPASRPERCFPSSAVLRGRDGISSDNDANPTGAELFQGNCASCHASEGQGSKDGYYPSLFHNSATGAKNPTNLIAAILLWRGSHGLGETSLHAWLRRAAGRCQPSSATATSRCWEATCSAHYGAGDTTVTAQEVNEIRQGGPASSLLLLARGGLAAAVVVLILAAIFLVFRRERRPRLSH